MDEALKDKYDIILVGDYAPSSFSVSIDLPRTKWLAINLEGPVSEHAECRAIAKAGPHLMNRSLPKVDCKVIYSVANNHFMDFGQAAAQESIRRIEDVGDQVVGYGQDAIQARRPLVVTLGTRKVAFVAFAEKQFGVASHMQPGVASFSHQLLMDITRLRRNVDLLIVSVDGGLEDYPLPSMNQVDLYRGLVSAGADVVWGHHPHVTQPVELWEHGLIAYGLGNFAVPCMDWNMTANALWSLGIGITIAPDDELYVRLIPLTVASDGVGIKVKIASAQCASGIQERMDLLSKILDNQDLYLSLWHEISMNAFAEYGSRFLGWARWSILIAVKRRIRVVVNRVKSLLGRKCSSGFDARREEYSLRYHMFSCESHRAMSETALGIMSGEIQDLRTAESSRVLREVRKPIVSC